MTSGRSGKDDNLWRDLAATVVQQVADRVRSAHDAARSNPNPHPSPAPDSAETTRSSGPGRRPFPAPSTPWSHTSSVGGELKRLMADGIRATADSISEYQADRERRAAERERKRLEAPMRKAQSRSRANKAGAVGMGVLALGMLSGTVNSAAESDAPAAVPAGVVTVGFGAGAVVLTRRGMKYSQIADEEARRLGASSAAAVSIQGPSAYSVPLPPQSSLAYDPTRRLLAQKKALAELLPEIAQLAPELAPLARESESTLAAYAERITKLERAQAASNGSSSLDAPLARAVAQYEEGVDAHQKLVEAAATVMAELTSTGIGDPAHHSIDAAADRLQGLAEGLRQVRNDIPMGTSDSVWNPPSAPPSPTRVHPAPRPGGKPNRRRDLAD